LTGAFSSGVLLAIGLTLKSWGGFMSPVTDTILLALGHVTELLALSIRWIGETFGVDTNAVVNNMRAAEEARPTFEQEAQRDPPALLAMFVAVFSTLFFGAIAFLVFHRLIGRLGERDDEDVEEDRSASRGRRGSLFDLFRRSPRDLDDADLDTRNPREAIRLQYRRFQTMLARAGLERRNGQTPGEYRDSLAEVLPDAREPLARITDAYGRARYGDQTARLPEPQEVDQAVAQIRGALQELANAAKEPNRR
jgi:hypothetical protein